MRRRFALIPMETRDLIADVSGSFAVCVLIGAAMLAPTLF